MTLTEHELRATLTDHVQETPGDGGRLGEVHGRIHRSRRRRQAAASGVLALAVAGVAIALAVPGHGSNASVTPARPQPAGHYGTAALAGPGPVLLDATTGRTSTGHGGNALGLSYDGRYLASSVGTDHTSIRISDVAGRVLLTVPTGTAAAAWSPTSDVLAVVGISSTATTTLYDVRDGGVRPVARTVTGGPDGEQQLAWSPDGSRLAVGSGHVLTVLDSAGSVVAQQTFSDSGYPAPATWSGDGSHLVVFVHTVSSSVDADGVQVVDLDAAGHQVGMLPTSLADPQWWHPLSGAAVLGTVGGDREVGHGKTVARCDLATAHCTTLAGGGSTSSFDAVPTTTGIAYLSVTGSSAARPQGTLLLASSDGSGAHAAPGAPAAVSQIVASTDGRTLLLVGASAAGTPGIYRYDGTAAEHLANVSTDDASGYYGLVDEIVSWRQPAASPTDTGALPQ